MEVLLCFYLQCLPRMAVCLPGAKTADITNMEKIHQISIVGLVVEFVVAIDEARVRFTDDALFFVLVFFLVVPFSLP